MGVSLSKEARAVISPWQSLAHWSLSLPRTQVREQRQGADFKEPIQVPIRESFRSSLTALLCCTLCTPAPLGIAQSPAPPASRNPTQIAAPPAASSALLPTVHGRRP